MVVLGGVAVSYERGHIRSTAALDLAHLGSLLRRPLRDAFPRVRATRHWSPFRPPRSLSHFLSRFLSGFRLGRNDSSWAAWVGVLGLGALGFGLWVLGFVSRVRVFLFFVFFVLGFGVWGFGFGFWGLRSRV